MESLWRKLEEKQTLQGDEPAAARKQTHWDVIVVGAGMAGLLTAFYLKEAGRQVLVLEACETASGQTERTTAKITSQHGLKYDKLIKTVGKKKAQMYARANEDAIREYERLIQQRGIDCGFERISAYLYSVQEEIPLKREAQAAASLGIDVYYTEETELPFSVAGAVCFRNQAQFSPLEFLKNISAKLEIWEHTQVLAVHGRKVILEDRVLTADKIVITSHYPFRNVPGFYFLRQHQERSYVLALSGCEEIKGMYYGIDPAGLSLRQAGEYLLLGGGAHRTGQKKQGGAYDFLLQEAKKYFPDCKIEAAWSAQDCMPHDGIPFIGRYSLFLPHLYVATGFQKWGMTSSMIAARLLRDAFCGRRTPYAGLFSPQRFQFRAGIGNLLLDVGMSVKGLVQGLFQPKRRCSHMGCALTWNPDEESWDCPCHGSRFDAEGKLLDNPARKDAGSIQSQ